MGSIAIFQGNRTDAGSGSILRWLGDALTDKCRLGAIERVERISVVAAVAVFGANRNIFDCRVSGRLCEVVLNLLKRARILPRSTARTLVQDLVFRPSMMLTSQLVGTI